ncbi:transposase [Endozoicomonas sp.]|uniref:DesA/ISL3 alpha bundle tail domain-containing protein n=1 Tax=Endozoicomonas sp. TaxID=1892382 RepID=UPI00288736A9|nr:transposase [Endozoicomonas sp.]
MNEDLNQAYILNDILKQLWTYKYKASASKFLDKWVGLAKETGISELERFAKGLNRARTCERARFPFQYFLRSYKKSSFSLTFHSSLQSVDINIPLIKYHQMTY